jgi:alkylation response protein AidB-like acyl-CoA dehydrogenase
MDFELTDDQELLRASVRRFLAERAPLDTYVRSRLDAPHVGDDDVWRGLVDLGVLGLLVPEAHGGAGGTMVDAAVVLEELGRAVCPAPYASSAVGATSVILAAGAAADHAAWLPSLADGSVIGTVAWLEAGRRYGWRAPATLARRSRDGWLLDGEKVHVPDGAAAGRLVVVAGDDVGTIGAFVVDARDRSVGVSATPTVDGTRKEATVVFHDTPAQRLGDGGDASPAISAALDRMAIAAVVDGVGAAARALEIAVGYAKERVQFGRPIGSFQAVQHLCADMLRTVELGRAAAYYACWASDAAPLDEARRAATVAKAFASDAFADLGGTAIQVFGGVGFTWEHDVHLFYKRLLTLSVAFGDADHHLAALADQVLPPAPADRPTA